jgi:hypothetical protein
MTTATLRGDTHKAGLLVAEMLEQAMKRTIPPDVFANIGIRSLIRIVYDVDPDGAIELLQTMLSEMELIRAHRPQGRMN